jgi:hypothetical protein
VVTSASAVSVTICLLMTWLTADSTNGRGSASVEAEQVLVGGGDRLGAGVVLADPRQPVVRERREARLRDLAQADTGGTLIIARPGEQHRADADVQVLTAGAALAEVGERIGKPGPSTDLQQHFRERDAVREHVGDGRAQRAQPLRFVERLELAEVAAIGPGDLSDLPRRRSFPLVGPGTYLATSPRTRAVAQLGPVGAGAPSRGAELAI